MDGVNATPEGTILILLFGLISQVEPLEQAAHLNGSNFGADYINYNTEQISP